MSEEVKNEEVKEEIKEEVKNEEEIAKDAMKKEVEQALKEVAAISKSKQKREARKEEVKAAKKKATWGKIIEAVVMLLIAAAFIAAIVLGIIKSATAIQPSSNYSAFIDDDGCIEGADLTKVKDLDLLNLVVPASEVEYTEEEIETDLENLRENFKEASSDPTLVVNDGDVLNIDFVGTMDGVEFEGGNSNGEGASCTVGSGGYIDDFEEQLIGAHPGDTVTVEVTFPEEYSNAPDLAGKDASFEVTINTIEVLPEITDEFIAENASEFGSTVEEFKDYMRTQGRRSKIGQYITEYIIENAEVEKYPKNYLKNVEGNIYHSDEAYYESMCEYYMTYMGYSPYNDFYEYLNMSESDYFDSVEEQAKSSVAQAMTYEKALKDFGLTVETIDYNMIVYTLQLDEGTYGHNYIKQIALQDKVVEYLCDRVTVQ